MLSVAIAGDAYVCAGRAGWEPDELLEIRNHVR